MNLIPIDRPITRRPLDAAAIFAARFFLCMIGVALFGAIVLAERYIRQHYRRR